MKKVWILVSDSARARLFETTGNGNPWKLLDSLTHGESRDRAADIVEGGVGTRSAQGAGVHHNALVPSSTPKENEKGHFGHALAKLLDEGMRAKRFDHLVLVAAPQFLGMLKKELSPQLEKHLLASLDKDFTHMDETELVTRLHDAVRLPPE